MAPGAGDTRSDSHFPGKGSGPRPPIPTRWDQGHLRRSPQRALKKVSLRTPPGSPGNATSLTSPEAAGSRDQFRQSSFR